MDRKRLSILILFLLLCSCDEFRALPPQHRIDVDEWEEGEEDVVEEPETSYSYVEATGHYIMGFECSCFYPCGSDEMWWVSGGDLAEKYRDVLPIQERGRERVFVKLAGMVSELGRYGHLGGGDRRFEVMRVNEIRRSSDIDCE